MRRKSITLTCLGMALLLCACKAKTIAERIYFARLFPPEIGVTKKDETLRLYGKPQRIKGLQDGDVSVTQITWAAIWRGKDAPEGQILQMEFDANTDLLKGYLYASTFRDHAGAFEFSKRNQLQIGHTTLAKVYESIGYPSGRCFGNSTLLPKHVSMKANRPSNAIILSYESQNLCKGFREFRPAERLWLVFEKEVLIDVKYKDCQN